MKKFSLIIILCLILTTGCTGEKCENSDVDGKDVSMYVQESEQLYLDFESSDTECKDNSLYSPVNYKNQIGIWLPFMDYEDILINKSEEQFKECVKKRFSNFKAQGFNTVYVHVRAYGDAYYKSEVFPKGTLYNGDYDPLQIMVEEAHSQELSIQGWINPLRCQTEEQMKTVSDEFKLKKWYAERNGTYICTVNGRCYLNPAYDDVISLITDGVSEILENYDVDGIHIDDYFYPTVDESFDMDAFSKSGENDLVQWRLNNCSKMVKAIYDCVKEKNKELIFSISPQGRVDANYTSQFADVKLWGSTKGYCDCLIPQLYYGFENESCPFEKALDDWESIVTCSDVSLVIGLAGYKQGKEDTWAGSGKNEWIEHDDIIERQKEIVNSSLADGYAVYN